jgi:hypothetical protein
MSSATAILQLTQTRGLGSGTLDRVLKRLSKEGRNVEGFVMAKTASELTNATGNWPRHCPLSTPLAPTKNLGWMAC